MTLGTTEGDREGFTVGVNEEKMVGTIVGLVVGVATVRRRTRADPVDDAKSLTCKAPVESTNTP